MVCNERVVIISCEASERPSVGCIVRLGLASPRNHWWLFYQERSRFAEDIDSILTRLLRKLFLMTLLELPDMVVCFLLQCLAQVNDLRQQRWACSKLRPEQASLCRRNKNANLIRRAVARQVKAFSISVRVELIPVLHNDLVQLLELC